MTENEAPSEFTPTLNQDLKNPHLVETAVFFEPVDGWLLSKGQKVPTGDAEKNTFKENLDNVMKNAANGNIPVITKLFRISGVPLVLTDQSYLVIQLDPIFIDSQFNYEVGETTSIPDYFRVLRANWPKLASACIKGAKCTFSNFGVTSDWPFFYNYINALGTPDDIMSNERTSYFGTYVENTVQKLVYNNSPSFYYSYLGKDPCASFTAGSPSFADAPYVHSPFSLKFTPYASTYDAVRAKATFTAGWSENNSVNLKIPLREILPVFNVPVLPLLSTNSANIELTITFYDPRYMFMLYGALMSPDSASPISIPAAESLFACIDLDAYCFMNLKILTDPANNPLAKAYMEPFLVARNFFKARFTDYYIFQNDISIGPGQTKRFAFRPSQMFYNMTHVALFFYNGQLDVEGVRTPDFIPSIITPLQKIYYLENARSLAVKGHYVLDEDFLVSNFQVGLGSSQTPLFSVPLQNVQLQQMTVDHFQKYGKNRMVGRVLQNRARMSQGDAFYVIDFTHARNSGFFVDADNMVSITGEITWKAPVHEGNTAGQFLSWKEKQISVICVVFYTNYFTVLLDQGGSVIISQV